MGIAERKELEKEILRGKILTAASELLAEEGYEKLSIRKIASRIEYSPGIIYHYFKDKSEIVLSVAEQGYKNIVRTLNQIPLNKEKPEITVEKSLRAYIELVLEMPEHYRAILMNDIEEARDKVNILTRGISTRRGSISILCSTLKAGIENGRFKDIDPELTSQIIWTSTYGLICRLILEKDVTMEQRNRLVDHHIKMLIMSIMK